MELCYSTEQPLCYFFVSVRVEPIAAIGGNSDAAAGLYSMLSSAVYI